MLHNSVIIDNFIVDDILGWLDPELVPMPSAQSEKMLNEAESWLKFLHLGGHVSALAFGDNSDADPEHLSKEGTATFMTHYPAGCTIQTVTHLK